MTGSFVKKVYIFEITFTKKEEKIVYIQEPSFSSCVVLAIEVEHFPWQYTQINECFYKNDL